VAETRWQRIKGWFIASDPDEVAREEYQRAGLRRGGVDDATPDPASSGPPGSTWDGWPGVDEPVRSLRA
jgi:hypothetical protein